MSRIYSVAFSAQTFSAAVDFFVIEANTNIAIIHRIILGQYTEFADAQAELVPMELSRITDVVTDSSTGTPMDIGDAAESADVQTMVGTQLVTGISLIHADSWNVMLPYDFFPPPELRPIVEIGNAIKLHCDAAPADAMTINGTIYWEERGS